MQKRNRFLIYAWITIGFVFICSNSCQKVVRYEPSNKVTDIDGNSYNTITIGTQTWMKENLKTTRYSDGSAIPNIADRTVWNSQTSGAYCWYNNDIANKTNYGALYNFYAVMDIHELCPTGWHVPAATEWKTLTTYLGGDEIAGGKLKSTTLWATSTNPGASNSTGFTALPGGGLGGGYEEIAYYGNWWTATAEDNTYALIRNLYYANSIIYSVGHVKSCGFSVRCIMD